MRKVVNFLKTWLSPQSKVDTSYRPPPIVLHRKKHKVSRSHISEAALKVLYRLSKSGYCAYLVGGSVRDLLLGHIPKDFDIATDAHPEQVRQIFRNSYIVGRRFRLVHVRFGEEVIEVATFRSSSKDSRGHVQTQHGLLLSDNVYGTLEDDIWRRDFTVNALYYNIADFSVVDFTGGMEDLKQQYIRVIGDPVERYREDPARMLRAVRFAAKLDFKIEQHSAAPIKANKELLLQVSPARLFDKMLKIFHSGKSVATFKLLQEYELFSILFPQTARFQQQQNSQAFLTAALKNTDERVREGKTINSAFLFAVLLWGPLQAQKASLNEEDFNEHQAFHTAATQVITEQLKIISIPKRFMTITREIWLLQLALEKGRPKRIYKIFEHPRFRAAYDFLGLRCHEDESLVDLFTWWTDFQEADEEGRRQLIHSRFPKNIKRRRKKKKNIDG